MTKIYYGIFYEHMEQGMDHMIYCLFNNDPFFETQCGNRDRLIEWKTGDILRIYIKDKMVKEIQIHNMDSFYQNPLELDLDYCRTLAFCNAKIELIQK